jgi:hypothetical protein
LGIRIWPTETKAECESFHIAYPDYLSLAIQFLQFQDYEAIAVRQVLEDRHHD